MRATVMLAAIVAMAVTDSAAAASNLTTTGSLLSVSPTAASSGVGTGATANPSSTATTTTDGATSTDGSPPPTDGGGVATTSPPLPLTTTMAIATTKKAGPGGASSIVKGPLVAPDSRTVTSSQPSGQRVSGSGAVSMTAGSTTTTKGGDDAAPGFPTTTVMAIVFCLMLLAVSGTSVFIIYVLPRQRKLQLQKKKKKNQGGIKCDLEGKDGGDEDVEKDGWAPAVGNGAWNEVTPAAKDFDPMAAASTASLQSMDASTLVSGRTSSRLSVATVVMSVLGNSAGINATLDHDDIQPIQQQPDEALIIDMGKGVNTGSLVSRRNSSVLRTRRSSIMVADMETAKEVDREEIDMQFVGGCSLESDGVLDAVGGGSMPRLFRHGTHSSAYTQASIEERVPEPEEPEEQQLAHVPNSLKSDSMSVLDSYYS